MPILFVYILKLSISLAVVFIFYHIVLRKLTFYSWNRWYLLGYSVLSFFIAFFNITPLFNNGSLFSKKAIQLIPVISFNSDVPVYQNAVTGVHESWDNWNWCFLILIVGVVVLSTRLLIQYFSFLGIRNKAQLLSENETRVYHVEANIIPFSFGNSIFLNKRLHSPEELQEIVRHEFVHVKQKHSIDILCSELFCIFNWYNPFSWLLKKSIRQNLEFIADGKVLQSGMDKKEYQYLLLKVIGNNHFSIASQFNFSSLKKRIAMMNKMKTARVHIVKFLFIVPLVAVLLIAFRKKEHAAISNEAQLNNVPKEFTFSSVSVSYDSDTTPKSKADRKQMDDRGIDQFEITDKKAVLHLRNGKTEEYDITDSSQRRTFEAKYGKIISLTADTGEPAPVTAVTPSGETSGVSRPSVATVASPAGVTTIDETVIAASPGPVTTISTPATAVTASASPTKAITVIDDSSPVVATADVLVTITKRTSARDLEDFKHKMKDKGYELQIDKTSYTEAGTLTHVSGSIKSADGQSGDFSATDFERVILSRIKVNDRSHWRIEIVDKKKVVI